MNSSELMDAVLAIKTQVNSNTITYAEATQALDSYDISTIENVAEYKLEEVVLLINLYKKSYQDRLNGIPEKQDAPTEESESPIQ